jgi:hypothetical protein
MIARLARLCKPPQSASWQLRNRPPKLLQMPNSLTSTVEPPAPRLLDQLRAAIRVRHDAIRTETAYVDWVRRSIRFHGLRHPRDLGAAQVEAFLSDLAVQRHVSASTQAQAQARSALLFLDKEVLRIELPWLSEGVVARPSRRLPVVLTPGERPRCPQPALYLVSCAA